MRLNPPSRTSACRGGKGGFTMIEIAIAIGVIGFALVAIIGILPRGMNVQKDNREDTIISQDAPYFLNAIRNGEQRSNQNFFTNFVESISITTITTKITNTTAYNNTGLIGGAANDLPTDYSIIGLLTTPEYDIRCPDPDLAGRFLTNQVTATVRAMSGSALTQSSAATNMAFRYQVTIENVPWNSIAFDSINYGNYPAGSYESNSRYARFYQVTNMLINLHEVRLKFAWPVLPNGTVGPNRQTYRTLVSSHLEWSNAYVPTNWFFEPQFFTANASAP